MKYKYYVWEGTPLKFYKFLCVILPVGAFISAISIGNFLYTMLGFKEYHSYEYYLNQASFDSVFSTTLFLSIVSFILTVAAAVLLNKRRWDGVICYLVNIVWTAINHLYSQWTIEATAGTYAGAIIAFVLFFYPVYVYFRKRRPLFSPTIPQPEVNQNNDAAEQIVKSSSVAASPSTPTATIKIDISAVEDEPIIHYCRKCGTKLAEESFFCHKCGTKAVKE